VRKGRPAWSFVRSEAALEGSRGPRFYKSCAGTATHSRHIYSAGIIQPRSRLPRVTRQLEENAEEVPKFALGAREDGQWWSPCRDKVRRRRRRYHLREQDGDGGED